MPQSIAARRGRGLPSTSVAPSFRIIDLEQVTSATKSEWSGGERFSKISINSCSFSTGPNTHNTVPCSLTLLVNDLVSIPSIPGTP